VSFSGKRPARLFTERTPSMDRWGRIEQGRGDLGNVVHPTKINKDWTLTGSNDCSQEKRRSVNEPVLVHWQRISIREDRQLKNERRLGGEPVCTQKGKTKNKTKRLLNKGETQILGGTKERSFRIGEKEDSSLPSSGLG